MIHTTREVFKNGITLGTLILKGENIEDNTRRFDFGKPFKEVPFKRDSVYCAVLRDGNSAYFGFGTINPGKNTLTIALTVPGQPSLGVSFPITANITASTLTLNEYTKKPDSASSTIYDPKLGTTIELYELGNLGGK